jgi:hypothetical protein
VSSNGTDYDRIPGAPQWVQEFFARVDRRFDVLLESLNLAVANLSLAAGEYKVLRDRVAELEEWKAEAENRVVKLETYVRRSLTPPSGIPAVGNSDIPDDAA